MRPEVKVFRLPYSFSRFTGTGLIKIDFMCEVVVITKAKYKYRVDNEAIVEGKEFQSFEFCLLVKYVEVVLLNFLLANEIRG